MKKNWGHLVSWKNKTLYNKYANGYYIITDSDIMPNENLPEDYIKQMMNILDSHKEIVKVGFSLKIDDIPDHYALKNKVLSWEKQYWDNIISKDPYLAHIDTTFALYYPMYQFSKSNFFEAIRMSGNFEARHIGWYSDSSDLSEEEKFYKDTTNKSNTW